MQAVILAGGLGTRLWPLTKEIPKPMVPVAGVPYLEHQLRLLAKQGIEEIVLLIGYLGEQIETFFGDGRHLGLHISYSRESTPLGTGGGLREAKNLLSPSFLVIYGDSYLPIDYADVLKRLNASTSATGIVVVYDNGLGDTSVENNIAISEEGLVIRYSKGTVDRSLTHVEAGVLAFRREVLDLLPPDGVASLEKEVFPKLIARRGLLAYPTTQRFYDIGTPDRLQAIRGLFTE